MREHVATPSRRRARMLLLSLFAAAAVVALAGYGVGAVREYVVVSASMEPTLHCASAPGCKSLHADRLIASALPYLFSGPARGDVVLVDFGSTRHACAGSVLVKRVVALPGEQIEQVRGRLWVDGRRLREPYLRPRTAAGLDFPERRLGSGHYFVMGDNRAHSCDSREFGAVARDRIAAKVLLTLSG